LLILALLLASLTVVVACGGSSQPPAEPAAPATPAPAAQSEASKHMHEHLARVTEIQEAVTRGDLEAAGVPAAWLADHEPPAGLPATVVEELANMKKTSKMVVDATNINDAGTATAQLLAACGTCHTKTNVVVKFDDLPRPPAGAGVSAHMLEHQWAMDLMMQGLVGPSEMKWRQGAEALKVSPMAAEELPQDEKLTDEIKSFEKKVHEWADKAVNAGDMGSKVAIYGEVTAGCASCHGLHGKTWGPGLPK
jgi:cytochrome c553